MQYNNYLHSAYVVLGIVRSLEMIWVILGGWAWDTPNYYIIFLIDVCILFIWKAEKKQQKKKGREVEIDFPSADSLPKVLEDWVGG